MVNVLLWLKLPTNIGVSYGTHTGVRPKANTPTLKWVRSEKAKYFQRNCLGE
jgi:hypothetical protein